MTARSHPNWTPPKGMPTIAERLPKFESGKAAERKRDKFARALRRGSAAAQRLARKLERCTKKRPCNSAACRMCTRRLRGSLGLEMLGCLAERRDLLLVTIVPWDGRIPANRLDEFDVRQFVNTTRQRLLRAALPPIVAIGGMDVIFDENDGVYQFHFKLIVSGVAREELQRQLQSIYGRTPEIFEPITIRPVWNRASQFAYVLKSSWRRAVRYSRKEFARPVKTLSRSHPLKEQQLEALLAQLDRLRPRDLIFALGAKVGADGRIRLSQPDARQMAGTPTPIGAQP